MSEITVTSTTDTQQAIELAAGLNQENRVQVTGETQEISPAEPEQDHAETSSTEERQEGNRENEDTAGKPASSGTPKSRTQKQIEALTQRAHEQQEELEALRNQVSGNKNQEIAQPGNAGRPTPAQYPSHDEFIEALADWKAGQLLQQQRQAELIQAEQARTREIFDTYNQAANSARTKYPDFEKVVGRSDLKIPQAAQIAIIEAGHAGPHIAYYLGKHPEMCRELAEMSPMRAIARIGQIEAEIGSSRHRVIHGTPGQVGSLEKTQTRPTAPPAPITPVGGSAGRSSVPMGELPYRDYKRLRDQEEKAGRF